MQPHDGRRDGPVKTLLASALVVGRRHVSKLFCMLALVGVPVAVIAVSGGRHTIAFWIVTLVWMTAVVYVTALSVFIIFIVLSPVLLMLEDLISDRVSAVAGKLLRLLVLAIAAAAFVHAARLGDTTTVRLPTPWPNLGALLVITVAAVAARGLWSLGRRFRVSRKPTPYGRRHSVPEPEDEFWSDQHVVAWRSWAWDGSSLRGVYARWPAAELEATCPYCEVVPSWDHACGIYAAKTPTDIHLFHGGTSIVGKVEMWGHVIEHEFGYRASHARIAHLWVDDRWRAERVSSTYPGVEVSVGSPVGQEVA